MTELRFDVIAKSYEAANLKYPNCRNDHQWFLEHYDAQHSKVLEISGGTGFLTEKLIKKQLPNELFVHDVSREMLEFNKRKLSSFEEIKYVVDQDKTLPSIPNNYFDAAFSLGGFHHIEDQIALFKAVRNKLTDNGIFCVGDFSDHSPVQRYFDEKINEITLTGHQGLFASKSRLINLARFSGFNIQKIECLKIPFSFENQYEVGEFFQMVHGLDQDPNDTFVDIKNYFEIISYQEKMLVLMDYVYGLYCK